MSCFIVLLCPQINLNLNLDMHTHNTPAMNYTSTQFVIDNLLPFTFNLLTSGQSCLGHARDHRSTDFDAGSSSGFPFKARTNTWLE